MAKRSKSFGITFGALAPSLAEQLDCKPSDVDLWQKDADAITRLLVRDLIPDSVGRAARKKLLKRIAARVGVDARPASDQPQEKV